MKVNGIEVDGKPLLGAAMLSMIIILGTFTLVGDLSSGGELTFGTILFTFFWSFLGFLTTNSHQDDIDILFLVVIVIYVFLSISLDIIFDETEIIMILYQRPFQN